jgi:hypothetical protein
MSEYQYYEFQAIDRPLDEADRRALRAISTRARITATSFTNTYEWGDLKGDPTTFMERWFDLHLYLSNWGSRRLMIRLPARLVDRTRCKTLLRKVDSARLLVKGEHLILDIHRNEAEGEEWDDGTGWLASLAPLRADLLTGDLRIFYLLWLTAVEAGDIEEDEPEPLPGLGPVTPALEACTQFFVIDPDLVQAAAERVADPGLAGLSGPAVRRAITAMPEAKKTKLLLRLFENASRAAAELRSELRQIPPPEASASPGMLRSAGELLARAEAIRLTRAQAAAERAAMAKAREAKAAEKERQARLDALARRGESVWQEVELEIERRNALGYDRAVALLIDLKALTEQRSTPSDFAERLAAIRNRHARKPRFLERLTSFA